MKKFASLGRSLSLQEQKGIIGGDDDDDRYSSSCETKVSCFCNNTRFQCCSNHIDDCVAAHHCGDLYACAG